MNPRRLPLMKDRKARVIFDELCCDHEITMELVEELIEVQRENLGRERQMGITQDFHATIGEFIDRRKEEQHVLD